MKDKNKTKEQLINELNELRQNNTELKSRSRNVSQNLKESGDAITENRLEFLLANSPAVIYTCEFGGNWTATFMSENVKEVFGYKASEFIGNPNMWVDGIHPEDREQVFTDLNSLIKNGYHSHEYRFLHKNGNYVWIYDEVRVVRDQQGNPFECIGYWTDISERNRVEEKLREREQRLQTIIETEPECVKIISSDGMLVEMNAAGLAMIEAESFEQVAGQPIYSLIVPEDRDAFRKHVESVCLGNKESLVFEVTGLKGTRRWLETHAVPLRNAKNEITEILGITRDITEQKQAEGTLSRSENELSSIYNAITDFMTVIRTDYRIKRVNRVVEEHYGKDLVGKMCYEVYQGRKEICPDCATRKAIETKKPAFSFQPATKVSPPVDIYAFPILNKEGDVIAVVEHGKDITERKRAEEALIEGEERYRNITENASIGIATYHESGQCVIANQAWADMVGGTVEQLVSQNINTLDSWKKSGMLDTALEALESGEKLIKTFHLVTSFGKKLWLECKIVPYYEREEKFLMFLAEEVTHRKTLEEERSKAQKLESIGVLAGGIAHDFNNLLTAIMNNLFLMKKHIGPEEKVYEHIIATERASARAQGLTQQLLTFSKGGAPVKELIDIRELISESIFLALRGSNVSCENLIPYDLWHIEADACQMNQSINNLLINADQSMPEGGIITINGANIVVGIDKNLPLKEGNYIKLSIKDEGTGISKEHLSSIFDPYFSTKQKGSGLVAQCLTFICQQA
jgi:PAS domain S-box-containing protein